MSKISQYTAYTTPISTDVLPIVDVTTATTKKITWASILTALGSSLSFLPSTLTSLQLKTALSDETGSGAAVFGTSPTLSSPAITTPTGIVAGDVGLGSVNNTSDATKNSATATLTNKRITRRIGTEASSATSTPTADTVDEWTVTALAAADAFAAPTGTPTDGQTLLIRIKDNGTARALTWNAIYRFSTDLAAPSTTVISKTLYVGFVYNAASSTWDCILAINNY